MQQSQQRRPGAPIVTGLSPKEGNPGTQITIRGENLGTDPSDLAALFICNTDCLVSAKWKSSSKIVARLGQAKRGPGDVVIVTHSGGRGNSEVKFRVFIEEVSPLQESSVWVDETHTVPGRNVVRAMPEVSETDDMLGLRVDPQKKMDQATLSRMFPEGSGNRRMESFSPAWYLLENHKYTKLDDLRRGINHLRHEAEKEKKTSKDVHKANLFALISCVDALHQLYTRVEEEKKTRGWPLTTTLAVKIDEAKGTADRLFKDVLGRKDRADATRNALSVLTRFKFIFFLAESIEENMTKGEYATILNDYTRAKALFKDSEVPLFKEVKEVLDRKMVRFKGQIREKLMNVPTTFEEQSKLIKYLKALEPESDPAWECITAYHVWLEDILWELQGKHYEAALDEHKQHREGLFPVESANAQRQQFVTELLGILTDKLQSFWKLSQSYSNASDEKYLEKQDGVNQMMINTINVSSWLMLNALVPNALPKKISEQYKDQFVKWPEIPSKVQLRHLFFALHALRTSIKSLLEFQFTQDHVQPLVELCMTLRLQTVGQLIGQTSDAIVALAERENWKTDVAGNQSKTSLPDMYESEINEILPQLKTVLAYHCFPGETDLFSRDVCRQFTQNHILGMITSIKDCYDRLLNLNPSQHRPNHLRTATSHVASSSLDDSASISSANEDSQIRPMSRVPLDVQAPSSRKFLIAICNLEYVLNHSLPLVCKRLNDNGVKFAEVILEKAKQKLATARQNLIAKYLGIKQAPLVSLVEGASYDLCPLDDDVSYFIKEFIMCIVFVQAELLQLAPALVRQIVAQVVETAIEKLIATLVEKPVMGRPAATQVVVDLTALEEALQQFLSIPTRKTFSTIRARLMEKLNEEQFRNSMYAFHHTMAIAIQSLNSGSENSETFEALESSRV
uniref:Exocyst complex component 2 n=1 Tax=Panagrellus redivivus TaxID=6233 RepID=A0A7E4UPL3_PANRE